MKSWIIHNNPTEPRPLSFLFPRLSECSKVFFMSSVTQSAILEVYSSENVNKDGV